MKDKYGREIDYLRISLTDKCNLRCIYCMEEKDNNFIEEEKLLSREEIKKITKLFSKVGIKKVRLTGGEPLVRRDILEIMKDLNSIEDIKEIYITTNGILLDKYLEDFKALGLTGVNISLDSLKKDNFKNLTRLGNLYKVLNAIDKALDLGIKVKINTVLIKGINDNEILDFINLTVNKNIDVRFIELMPIGVGSKHQGVSNEFIINTIKENFKDLAEINRDKSGGPATYIKLKNAKGKIGFISAISNCFCEDCNRIRLTSEGFLKQCLHFNYGVNLKELIKNGASDEELLNIIKENIYYKPEKHLFLKESEDKELKFMNQIGG